MATLNGVCVCGTELPLPALRTNPGKRGKGSTALAEQWRGMAWVRALQMPRVIPLHFSACEHCWSSTQTGDGAQDGCVTSRRAGGMQDECFRGCQLGARAGWKSWAEGRGAHQLTPSEGSKPLVPPSSSPGRQDAARSQGSCAEVSSSSDAWQINVLIALALPSVLRSRCACDWCNFLLHLWCSPVQSLTKETAHYWVGLD